MSDFSAEFLELQQANHRARLAQLKRELAQFKKEESPLLFSPETKAEPSRRVGRRP